MRHIYICFDTSNSSFVGELRRRSENENLRVWKDDQIQLGDHAPKIIGQAIRNASIVLVVMSPAAKASEAVTHEWAFALGLGLRLIPVIVQHTALHPRLSVLKPLDFAENTISEAKWTQLTEGLKKLQQEQDTKTYATIDDAPFSSPDNQIGAWLIQTKGSERGKSWHLNKPVMIIGREVSNDTFIDNRSVSRRHAMIRQEEDGTYTFEDLGSTNGSVVNGNRVIDAVTLKNDDIVVLGGEIWLRFHLTE